MNSCVRSAGTYHEPSKLGVRTVARVMASTFLSTVTGDSL